MENRKIRVGITHGDINGVGYEVILKTFSDPTMLELCTPVIYGSPKVAAYHRKAMEIPTNFSIVNTAEDAQDGRVNVVNCIEEELKVELSKPTPEAGKAALTALEKHWPIIGPVCSMCWSRLPSTSIPSSRRSLPSPDIRSI